MRVIPYMIVAPVWMWSRFECGPSVATQVLIITEQIHMNSRNLSSYTRVTLTLCLLTVTNVTDQVIFTRSRSESGSRKTAGVVALVVVFVVVVFVLVVGTVATQIYSGHDSTMFRTRLKNVPYTSRARFQTRDKSRKRLRTRV
jgi:hypothetical protein